jgi:hypothetical protein
MSKRNARFALAGVLVTLAAFAASGNQSTRSAQRKAGPSLIVVLVVDQMRADYADLYGATWTRGLRRLIDRGAVFANAAFPYLGTVTCAGHATIATGTFPSTHGIILNEWWDREARRRVSCTDDPQAPEVRTDGARQRAGHSAKRLLAPTLASALRAQTGGRVVSLSLKARSAIMLGGPDADLVVWAAPDGTWATSTAFADAVPPLVSRLAREAPTGGDAGRVWTRLLPVERYRFDDDAEGERPTKGWGASFPHPLGDGAAFVSRWQASPFSDEYLARLAAAAVAEHNLGSGASVDFLGVTFSALDLVGHEFGPRSHEVQDVLARLDVTIGRLLDELDRAVGSDRYVVALTADHGVSAIPEQEQRRGRDAGRVRSADVARAVDAALDATLSPGDHVASVHFTDIYFAPGVADRLRASPAAAAAAIRALEQIPGVWRVFSSDELRRDTDDDPVRRAAALSHAVGRSGDLVLVPRENWIMSTAPATHGTLHPYDARVPLIVMGSGVTAGRYDGPATPADLAPTLARLAGVRFSARGRPLADALATP